MGSLLHEMPLQFGWVSQVDSLCGFNSTNWRTRKYTLLRSESNAFKPFLLELTFDDLVQLVDSILVVRATCCNKKSFFYIIVLNALAPSQHVIHGVYRGYNIMLGQNLLDLFSSTTNHFSEIFAHLIVI